MAGEWWKGVMVGGDVAGKWGSTIMLLMNASWRSRERCRNEQVCQGRQKV